MQDQMVFLCCSLHHYNNTVVTVGFTANHLKPGTLYWVGESEREPVGVDWIV